MEPTKEKFSVQITLLGKTPAATKEKSIELVKVFWENMLRTNSVGKELIIHPLEGKQCFGHYSRTTDKKLVG